MLVKFLSKNDRDSLIALAEFLSISDKPMLWNGKSMNEASARIYDDGVKFSFGRKEVESALLADWKKIPVEKDTSSNLKARPNSEAAWPFASDGRAGCDQNVITDAENDLICLLREVPLKLDTSAPEVRAPAVSTVIRNLHKRSEVSSKYAIKIVLFELMLMAFADGEMSAIELHVLRDLQHHYDVDEESFNEILEQAELVSRVTQKTIALIVE